MELLERGAQHAELQGALERARAGAGCIVLVAGEAGIGKTALAEDFTRGLAARTPRAPVLWGACDPLLTPRPLGPLLDMLPQCSATLRTLTESGAERARIFQAFLDELRRAPEPVVVFEDIHWADEATLDLLKFVGRRIRQTTGILIATYRDDEVGNEHPLRRVLGEIPAEALRRIRLPLLSESAVQRLARGAGRSAHRLYALTGGNPFFLTEVLAAEGAEVPASVQDAVLARAARLSAPAREVLGPVSVVPGRTERWLLDAVLGSASGDQVAECAAAGVLVATAASVSFRHELARRAWREALEPGRATMLHARVFDVLMQRGAEHVGFARLVHHAEGANLPEQVLHLAPEAAREASAVGAHREAGAHYDTALRCARTLTAAERAALLEAHSFELHLIADMDEAVRARGQALALRRRLDDRLREGSDLRWLSRLTWFQGRSEEAVRLGQEAVRVLEPLGSTAELAMAYSNLAQLAMLGDQGQDAVAWGERAIVLAGQVGDVETRAHALINVGSARMYAGQEAEGRALLEQALALSLENGFQDHAVRALTNRACFAVHSRNYAAAESFIAAALAFAGEHDIDTFNLYVHGWRARLHLERGDWPAAERDAQVVLGRYRVLDIVRFPALLVLGLLRARRGEPGAHPDERNRQRQSRSAGSFQGLSHNRWSRIQPDAVSPAAE